MHDDESDVRDYLESGTKLLTRKPLTGRPVTEEEKIKNDLSCANDLSCFIIQ